MEKIFRVIAYAFLIPLAFALGAGLGIGIIIHTAIFLGFS